MFRFIVEQTGPFYAVYMRYNGKVIGSFWSGPIMSLEEAEQFAEEKVKGHPFYGIPYAVEIHHKPLFGTMSLFKKVKEELVPVDDKKQKENV